MGVQLGSGEWSFEVNENWAKTPEEITLGDCAAVGVDRQNRVYAFNRGEHPVAVFDAEGNLLRTWGEGLFTGPHCEPHGVHMGPDDTIWLTDDGDHTVRHCTLDANVLMTLGVPGEPKPYMSGEPFHHCTHTALSPRGDIYVSDGYGNARIHKFSPDGKLLFSWGEPGTDPGQFNVPHNICCDPDGWVYVADRENHRLQVFDGNGKFETQWNNLHRPNGMCMALGANPLVYMAKAAPRARSTATGPISARASASIHPKGRCWRVSGRCMPGSHRASSPRRTAWPSTATATSMSANSPAGSGHGSRRNGRPSASASSTSSSRSKQAGPPAGGIAAPAG